MIYRTTKEQIDNYFAHEAISQSQLKLYAAKGWDAYSALAPKMITDKYFDEPKDHFIIGSLVDLLVTRPDDCSAEFYISTLTKKPSDTQISIIRKVFDVKMASLKDSGLELVPANHGMLVDNTELLIESFDSHSYYPKWSNEAKLKNFFDESIETYWLELWKSVGKQIVTLEDMTMCKTIAGKFLELPFFHDQDRYTVFFQIPLYCTMNDVHVKALLDMVVADHYEGVFSIYDFKTIADSVSCFPHDFRKRNYGTQGAFYHTICDIVSLKRCLLAYFPDADVIRHVDYHLDDKFYFIVASKSFPTGTPIIYSMSDFMINEYMNGRPECYIMGTNSQLGLTEAKMQGVEGIYSLLRNFDHSKSLNYDARFASYIESAKPISL